MHSRQNGHKEGATWYTSIAGAAAGELHHLDGDWVLQGQGNALAIETEAGVILRALDQCGNHHLCLVGRDDEVVEPLEELVGIGGDTKDKLAEVASFHRMIADLTPAVDDFFVGED